MIRALMPLEEGVEMVLCCADCGALSTDDVRGTDGWALRRVSAQRLVDVCPGCQPRPRSVTTSNGRARR